MVMRPDGRKSEARRAKVLRWVIEGRTGPKTMARELGVSLRSIYRMLTGLRARGLIAPRHKRRRARWGDYGPGPRTEAAQRALGAQVATTDPPPPNRRGNRDRAPTAPTTDLPGFRLHGGSYTGGVVVAPPGHPLRESASPAPHWDSYLIGAGRGTLVHRREFESGWVDLRVSRVTWSGKVTVHMRASYHQDPAEAMAHEQIEAARVLAVALGELGVRCPRPDAPCIKRPAWAIEDVGPRLKQAVLMAKEHGVTLPLPVLDGNGWVDESKGVVEVEVPAPVAREMMKAALPMAREAVARAEREDVDARIAARLGPVEEALKGLERAVKALRDREEAPYEPPPNGGSEGYA